MIFHLLLKYCKLPRLIVLGLFAILSIHTQAQVMTQPLFMQIKSPSLISQVGEKVDIENQIYNVYTTQEDTVLLSFLITVPQEMLSKNWGLILTPSSYCNANEYLLKDIIVKGWKFTETQEQLSTEYNNLINSVINPSLYEEEFLDYERFKREIEQQHDLYWQSYYDEWERQVEYEIWKAKQDGSIQTYSPKEQSTYSDILKKQYLLRIENQSNRYLKAGIDTTGLYKKYMSEYEEHNAKIPRYFVNKNMNTGKVPKRFKDINKSGRTLQDITNAMQDLLVKRDSALMSLPILNYKKITENEKNAILKSKIQQNKYQLYDNSNAKIDTTIYNIHSDFQYVYTHKQSIQQSDTEKIEIRLKCKVIAIDGSKFTTNSEDIIHYRINPAVTENLNIKEESELKETSVNESPKSKPETEKAKEKDFLERLDKRLQELNKSEIEVFENSNTPQ